MTKNTAINFHNAGEDSETHQAPCHQGHTPDDRIGTYVAIIGSPDFPNLDLVRRFVESLSAATTIVSRGVECGLDRCTAAAARARGLHVIEYLPQSDLHGCDAGHFRDEQIVQCSHRIIIFWSGPSPDTRFAASLAYELGVPVDIRFPDSL